MSWTVVLARNAVNDARKLERAGLKRRAERVLKILEDNPFEEYPRYEKLVGNLAGYYSRRIDIRHRLVYSVNKEGKAVHVLRMWSHYE